MVNPGISFPPLMLSGDEGEEDEEEEEEEEEEEDDDVGLDYLQKDNLEVKRTCFILVMHSAIWFDQLIVMIIIITNNNRNRYFI